MAKIVPYQMPKGFTFAMAIFCYTNFRLKVEQKASGTYMCKYFVKCIVYGILCKNNKQKTQTIYICVFRICTYTKNV